MARPYFWLVFSFICCCLVGSISAETTVDLKEYLLNKSFVSAIKKQDFDTAISKAKDLIEFDPSNQKYYYNLAQAYMFKEDFENAAKTYQKAQGSPYINLENDVNLGLGTAQLALNKLDAAIDMYKEILKKNPYNEAARRNLELALDLKNMPPPQQDQQENQSESSQDQQQNDQNKDNNPSQQDGNNESEDQDDTSNSDDNDSENDGDQDNQAQNASDDSTEDQSDQQANASPSEEELDQQKALELLQLLAPDEDDVRKKYMQKSAEKVTNENDW